MYNPLCDIDTPAYQRLAATPEPTRDSAYDSLDHAPIRSRSSLRQRGAKILPHLEPYNPAPVRMYSTSGKLPPMPAAQFLPSLKLVQVPPRASPKVIDWFGTGSFDNDLVGPGSSWLPSSTLVRTSARLARTRRSPNQSLATIADELARNNGTLNLLTPEHRTSRQM